VAEQNHRRVRLTHHLDRDHPTVAAAQLHPHIVSRDVQRFEAGGYTGAA
jgi:hypothetical protein